MKGYNSDFGSLKESDAESENIPINGVDYNEAGSSTVKKVKSIDVMADSHSLPLQGTPNSVTQNYRDGYLDSERYYDDNGKAYLDIDYSNHGNPKMHPKVPHQHRITYDENGKMHRDNKDTEIKK